MKRRKVEDLMTRQVVSVTRDASFVDIVETIEEHRFSAVPVVDGERRVVGIVTETDLLRKQEFADPEHQTPSLLAGIRNRKAQAKAGAVDAKGLMTAPAVTVSPETTVAEAARTLAHHKVNQLPVVDDDDHLVGIVTRSDVLRVFLRSDEEIRDEIVDQVIVRALWQDPSTIHVKVEDGMVHLSGRVELKSLVPIMGRLIVSVDGVVGVTTDLTYEQDDTRPAAYPHG